MDETKPWKTTCSGKEPETADGPAPAPLDPVSGQYKDHWVLTAEERGKGFVRPVRRSYRHLTCGTETSMPQAIAETYAREPHFYGKTFCCHCGDYLPVGTNGEFVWLDDGKKVGE